MLKLCTKISRLELDSIACKTSVNQVLKVWLSCYQLLFTVEDLCRTTHLTFFVESGKMVRVLSMVMMPLAAMAQKHMDVKVQAHNWVCQFLITSSSGTITW